MTLTRDPEHDYPNEPDSEGWHRCRRCGKPTRRPHRDTSWCEGLRQRSLEAGGDSHEDDLRIYGAFHDWIASLECLLRTAPNHRCAGRLEGHHVRSVGAGGKDHGNEVLLCERAHREIHRVGRETFEQRHDVDLRFQAQQIAQRAPDGIQEAEGIASSQKSNPGPEEEGGVR